jgi:hypothetical protein
MSVAILIAGIAIGIVVAALASGLVDDWMNRKKKDR